MSTTELFQGRSWPTWTVPNIVDVDGLATAYRRSGNGPTVVYLHAESGTRGWYPVHQALSESVDLIVPEHPGFGDTPLGAGFDRWDDWILHYEAFFRALDLDEFHIVGDSLGGWLAAELAAYFPARFASVSLITPLGLRLKEVKSVDLFRLDEDEVNEKYFNGRQAKYQDLLEQQDELEDSLQALNEATSLALLAWNPRYDFKLDRRLSRVKVPSLVVGVDDDRIASNEMAKRYAELIPGARLEIIHGASGEPSGHRVALEQPTETAELVARHILDHS